MIKRDYFNWIDSSAGKYSKVEKAVLLERINTFGQVHLYCVEASEIFNGPEQDVKANINEWCKEENLQAEWFGGEVVILTKKKQTK